jgi:hypothetical protein
MTSSVLDDLDAAPLRGAPLLGALEVFLARFVAYPTEHALVAHVLWIVHTHLMDVWESTPRIAFLSPEPGSGKTRALEVTEPFVPRPVHAVNTSPAYLFRKVSDEAGPPTILYDEIDTVFGPKAKDAEDIRGMLNAGHRKGAAAGRCVVRGKIIETEELPAYCAVAFAGLNDMPDTIMSRSLVVRMQRRKPGETVDPWRSRINAPEALPLAEALQAWAASIHDTVADPWPTMPPEVTDRNADVWEPLIAVADAAGGPWPSRARVAAVTAVTDSRAAAQPSLGLILLADLQSIFTASSTDRIDTAHLLTALHNVEESPWADLRGKPLDARGLAGRLKRYGISPAVQRQGETVARGYQRGDFTEAFARYLPPLPTTQMGMTCKELEATEISDHRGERVGTGVTSVTAVADDAPRSCTQCGTQLFQSQGPTICETCRVENLPSPARRTP